MMCDYFGKTKFLYLWDGIFVNHARDLYDLNYMQK